MGAHCAPTVKTPLPFPIFRSGHMSAIRARPSRKGRFTRGWKPQVFTLLCARAASAHSPRGSAKNFRVRANTPAAVRVPRSAGAEKRSRPVRANTLTQFVPGQPVPKSTCAVRISSVALYRENEKAPLTRCLSLLRICRPLSSSSCRNYRSRRRYYHHRYRRNWQPPLPDRSIPRSG